MHKLPKFGKNYNFDLPKVNNMTITDNYDMSKVRKMA